MLANIAKQSTGIAYEPGEPTVWANTKCWHFQAGSYILQENLAYNQLIPATDGGGNDYTIGGWFKVMYNGDMLSNSSPNYRETIYAMFNGNSTNSSSIMYGSIIELARWVNPITGYSLIKLGTHNENSNPFSDTDLQENSDTVNQWMFLTIRVKTSSSDDNVAWFVNGSYKDGDSLTYTQQTDENNYAIKIGGEDVEFYVSELGVWKDNLPGAAITSLYNGGTPVSFQENIGSYADANGKDALVAYYRFGDGTDDNPASFLHDETNDDNGSTATDLTSMIGEIHQIPLQNAGVN